MGGHTDIVVKFCKCHKAMVVLKESNNFQENILEKILEFYELKHPKHVTFTFISCWLVRI
jgi:hypothetical protein